MSLIIWVNVGFEWSGAAITDFIVVRVVHLHTDLVVGVENERGWITLEESLGEAAARTRLEASVKSMAIIGVLEVALFRACQRLCPLSRDVLRESVLSLILSNAGLSLLRVRESLWLCNTALILAKLLFSVNETGDER